MGITTESRTANFLLYKFLTGIAGYPVLAAVLGSLDPWTHFSERKKAPAGTYNISTMLVFQKSAFLSGKKPKLPFLPRDYCGAFLSLILIHRKALETLCLVTGLAQWAGTRIRSGREGREGPGFDSGHGRK